MPWASKLTLGPAAAFDSRTSRHCERRGAAGPAAGTHSGRSARRQGGAAGGLVAAGWQRNTSARRGGLRRRPQAGARSRGGSTFCTPCRHVGRHGSPQGAGMRCGLRDMVGGGFSYDLSCARCSGVPDGCTAPAGARFDGRANADSAPSACAMAGSRSHTRGHLAAPARSVTSACGFVRDLCREGVPVSGVRLGGGTRQVDAVGGDTKSTAHRRDSRGREGAAKEPPSGRSRTGVWPSVEGVHDHRQGSQRLPPRPPQWRAARVYADGVRIYTPQGIGATDRTRRVRERRGFIAMSPCSIVLAAAAVTAGRRISMTAGNPPPRRVLRQRDQGTDANPANGQVKGKVAVVVTSPENAATRRSTPAGS